MIDEVYILEVRQDLVLKSAQRKGFSVNKTINVTLNSILVHTAK